MSAIKTVGAYQAKTHLAELLHLVEKGREVIITKRDKPVARLVPAGAPVAGKELFSRIRALQGRLSLAKGETARDLIESGRRL